CARESRVPSAVLLDFW
nr:immunoglobulin heavy chain junction region [Macaca mulatta]MOV47567.1 immunoglobulin heavy chain junction region [Macaca mulatta]MOV47569.1 immunoglobulin heavy chain junction region [Macaca mulatta]MOV47671.1 immunoglobulin heavy chain junction region [Macaca mulatta]MOV47698.1 immunoglobulin heavy chain junction region [Macaca mulatta]